VAAAIALVLCVAAVWQATRRAAGHRPSEQRALVLGALGALLVVIALGKVLSPQYLIWLAGLLVLAWAHGERVVAALGGIAIYLTSAYFPQHYADLLLRDDRVILTVAARNLALCAALGLVLTRLARPHEPAGRAG
jgi:uncharacterized membrane protein